MKCILLSDPTFTTETMITGGHNLIGNGLQANKALAIKRGSSPIGLVMVLGQSPGDEGGDPAQHPEGAAHAERDEEDEADDRYDAADDYYL